MNASTKIVVLGETSVGKSTFVSTVCKKPSLHHESTVGAQVSICWHDYRAGSVEQRAEMMELWEIGGAASHRPASTVFLDGASGVILVHDLSNRKSEECLGQWLAVLNGDRRTTQTHSLRSLIADIEATQIPILIVGTKLDIAPNRGNAAAHGSVARINVDCRREMAPGSTNAMQLSKFFDAAIERSRGPSDHRRRKIVM